MVYSVFKIFNLLASLASLSTQRGPKNSQTDVSNSKKSNKLGKDTKKKIAGGCLRDSLSFEINFAMDRPSNRRQSMPSCLNICGKCDWLRWLLHSVKHRTNVYRCSSTHHNTAAKAAIGRSTPGNARDEPLGPDGGRRRKGSRMSPRATKFCSTVGLCRG